MVEGVYVRVRERFMLLRKASVKWTDRPTVFIVVEWKEGGGVWVEEERE